jgi:GDP-4-dehydro-6-deoxy-D-mannose reductase
MEMVGDMYVNSMGMDIIKVRSFNFAGPGQDEHFVCSDFSSQIARIEKGKRKPVIRVGNLSAVRDFSDVRDVAMYLKKIGERGQCGHLYHICSGNRISIQSVLDMLISFSKVEIEVVIDQSKFRPVDTPVLVGDCRLIREKFNCYPRFDFSQTLLDILNEWRNRIQ